MRQAESIGLRDVVGITASSVTVLFRHAKRRIITQEAAQYRKTVAVREDLLPKIC